MDIFLCSWVQNLKWVAALMVVKKILFYLIFCLLRSLVSHMQNDKIQIRKSLNSEHPIVEALHVVADGIFDYG